MLFDVAIKLINSFEKDAKKALENIKEHLVDIEDDDVIEALEIFEIKA